MQNDYFKQCIEKLRILTGKKHVFITKRGNDSIKKALNYARNKYDTIYYPDQGGWITYEQYAKKFKFNINIIKTNLGLIPSKYDFKQNSVIIYNSMPAYAFLTDLINDDCFIINDATATIGIENGKKGEIILGSFGRWKPINLGLGGFIATDLDDFEIENYMDLDFEILLYKINHLDNRLKFIEKLRDKILNDLKEMDIIYPKLYGLNVIVKFSDIEEREKLINYCLINNLEYTLCPKNIRVNVDAISIEIKRLEE